MSRILFVLPLVLMTSSASAQQRVGEDACSRDVSRFCRAQMQAGDQIILACLKQHRARISKACQQMLASHGQ
jgi:Cysteine rich repeat